MTNIQQYITPENVTLAAGIAGGIIALALLGLLIWNRRAISKGIADIRQSIFSQGGLFYIGMGLFMIASVVEAGPVINKIVMHDALFGYGGHMLVFAFDMISAVSLRARLNAKRVFDWHGMRVQMWGIVLPAIVSIVANFAGALQNFDQGSFNHLWIFAWSLPLIGAVFPSMIIVLSLAADHLLDTTAISDKIDPEEFKKQEKKRIDILKIRLTTEQDLLQEEAKIASIRSARDEAQGRTETRREWFFLKWIRPYAAPPMAAIKSEIEKAVGEACTNLEQQTNAQATTLAGIQQALSAITATQQAFAHQIHRQIEQAAEETRSHLEQEASTQVTTLAGVQQALTAITDQLTHLSAAHQTLTQQINEQSDQITLITGKMHQMSEVIAQTTEQLAQLSTQTASPTSVRAQTVRLLSTLDHHRQTPIQNGQEHGQTSVHADNDEDVDTREMESIDLKQRVADTWADIPEASAKQIADAIGCSRSTAGKWMKVLREEQEHAKQLEGSIA